MCSLVTLSIGIGFDSNWLSNEKSKIYFYFFRLLFSILTTDSFSLVTRALISILKVLVTSATGWISIPMDERLRPKKRWRDDLRLGSMAQR